MRHRRGRIDRLAAIEAKAGPALFALRPIGWRIDAFRLHPGPAIGQPVRRRAITAILDEGDPLAIGDWPVSQRMRMEQRFMPWPLAIEGEPAPALVANLDQPLAPLNPVQRIG